MTDPRTGNKLLELSPQQLRILDYILRKAQEDTHFFDSLVGDANRQAVNHLRITVAQLVAKTKELGA